MKVDYALYELEAQHALNAASSALKREGALLKVHFDSGRIGYADCHPWPELGDLPLKQQLEHLAKREITVLMHCALELASLDAGDRSQGKSTLIQQNIPKSHFLVINLFDWTSQHVQQMIQQGYTHVKLKVGRCIDREVKCLHALFLHTSLKLRLDFNETLTYDSFRQFLQRIRMLKDQIDFIEDPFPFDLLEWAAIQQEGWILACDRQVQRACNHPKSAQVLVIKPALQSSAEWQKWMPQTRIVTSYLGHPIGQIAAAYAASYIDPDCLLVHGLLSHHAYRPNLFSRCLNWQNPQFIVPPGAGFGFDQELNQLTWMSLIAKKSG